MDRQPFVKPVRHRPIAERRWDGLRGRYHNSSLRFETYMFNHTNSVVTYHDTAFGLLTVKPLGTTSDGFSGLIIQICVDVPIGEKPTPDNKWDNQLLDFIIENGSYETRPTFTRYRYGAEIDGSDIVPNKILEDRRLGIKFSLGDADWHLLGNIRPEGHSKNFRGHTLSVELVDDHRENIYLCGFSRVKPIRGVSTAVSGKREGIYVSTINQHGQHEVIYYTSCESCRAELDVPLFDKFHEAEAFIERGSMPSAKRSTGGSSGPSLSERLRERMENPTRSVNDARPSAKTNPGDPNRQRQSTKSSNEDEGFFAIIKAAVLPIAEKYPILVTLTLAATFLAWKVGPSLFEWLSKRERSPVS